MDFIKNLYYKARIKLGVNEKEFLDMALTEVNDLLSEYEEIKSLEMLQQANYNASMIFNEDAEKNFNDLYKKIVGEDQIKIQDKKTYIRYRNICKRLGLKYPKQLDKLTA